MRKIILLSLISISLNVFSQKSFFGLDAGINVANQRKHISQTINNTTESVSLYFQNSVKSSFGVFYQYQFNEKMGLRLNAQYMSLGYVSKGANPDQLSINYLAFPLTFHYLVTQHLSFSAGPYLSFTLGGTKINNEVITKTYHKNDDGFILGGEHDLYKNLSISVNYIFGLKNIWLNDSETIQTLPPITVHTKYTNRALQITLIYKFKKKS